jgi:SH3-like domain-containing protein
MMGLRNRFVSALMLGAILAAPLSAQERDLPYWASLRYDEVRMRVGPSEEYPIEWVYKRKGLPVKVVRVREGWRLIEDPEGAQGWIARSQGLAAIHEEPSSASVVKWRAQPGVVAGLLRCQVKWCEVDVAGRKGWIARDRLWGTEDLPGDE